MKLDQIHLIFIIGLISSSLTGCEAQAISREINYLEIQYIYRNISKQEFIRRKRELDERINAYNSSSGSMKITPSQLWKNPDIVESVRADYPSRTVLFGGAVIQQDNLENTPDDKDLTHDEFIQRYGVKRQ